MKKRILAVILAVMCFASCIVPAAAANGDNQIMPRWSNTSMVNHSLTFNGTTGRVPVSVAARSGVTSITVNIDLFYKDSNGNWIEIETDWDYSTTIVYIAIAETFTGVSGTEYKTEINITVLKDGYAEEIYFEDYATCP